MKKTVKRLLTTVLSLFLLLCGCYGLTRLAKTANAETAFNVTGVGAYNVNDDRFYVVLSTDVQIQPAGQQSITVSVEKAGVKEEISVIFNAFSNADIQIPTSAIAKTGEKGFVTIPKGTMAGEFVLATDYTFFVNDGKVSHAFQVFPMVTDRCDQIQMSPSYARYRMFFDQTASVSDGAYCNVDEAYIIKDFNKETETSEATTKVVFVGLEGKLYLKIDTDDLAGVATAAQVPERVIYVPQGATITLGADKATVGRDIYLYINGETVNETFREEKTPETLTMAGLTNQPASSRFIMTLNGGTGNGEYGSEICDVIVKTDGAEKTAKLWNWGEDIAIYIPYDVLPATSYHTLEIAEQTLFEGKYLFGGVSLAIKDGFVTTSITFDEVKVVFAEGYVQENGNLNIYRYRIYLTFDREFVAEGGVLGNRTISVNGKDVSAEVEYYEEAHGVILNVNLADAPKNQKNEIIVKAGTKLISETCNFTLAENFTVYTEGGKIDPVLPEPAHKDVKITSIEGVAQDVEEANLHRYLIYLNFDKEFEYSEYHVCDITVSVNGKDATVGAYNDEEDKRVFLTADYTVAPKESKNEITIKAETSFGDYVVSEDFSFVTEGDKVYVPSPELPEENVKITSIEGVAQDVEEANLHRYLIYLNFDKEFEYPEYHVCDITVSVNGKDATVGAYNDEEDKRVFLTADYTVAPKESKNEITIKAETSFAHFKLTKEVTIKTNGTAVEIKVPLKDMTVEWKKDIIGSIEGGTQDNLGRYVFYIQTDLENLCDTMWNGNECVIDAGTENERFAPIYYFGGIAKPDSEDYDGTAILVILNYKDIEEGARNAAEIATHSVTIKRGSELGGGYLIANDLTLWIRGENFAENEEELPEPPDGVFSLSCGIENKSIEYVAQNIEDYIENASVVKLKAGAEKLADNNVFFAAGDSSLFCKSIKIIGKKAEPQIKFRSVYGGGDVYLAFEIRSETDNGNYWPEQGAPVVRLRYCGKKAAETDVSECLWFDFFTDGLQNSPLVAAFVNNEFVLEEGEFFVEFGAVNKADSYGKEGFVFFVNVIQGEKQAYAECLMTGENNVSEAGDVCIYQAPFNTARIDVDYVKWQEKDVKDFTLMSVDKTRTTDGETIDIGVMSFYSPQLRREENYDKYDISDIVPIGNGKTYTKIEGDVTSASQSMINATNLRANNGGYSVKMKIKFTGEDFGCTFAFRGKGTNAASGYVIHIADDRILVGSMSQDSPFKTGETYEIEVGCVDYYVAEEKVASGVFVFLKVNGELVIEDSIDKKSGLGTYFCGLVEGAGDSTVTITAATNSGKQPVLTTKSNKTIVAKGKKTTLSCETDMPTAFDEVTYEIVKGKARIEGDGLYSESDGKITVRAKIVNEYGTFYGSEITLNAGKKDGGCKSSVGGEASVVLAVAAVAAMIFKKRREN